MLQYFPNITGSLQVTGSVLVSGSITATGGIVVSGSIASASYSSNSELLDNLDSTAFVFTSSFNTYSSSMSTRTSNLESTSSVLTTASASFAVVSSSYSVASGSLSTRVTRIEGNYATTGSNVFMGAQTVCANITSTGTIIAQTLNVQQVTSSIVYSSGSNTFGCLTTDRQQFTGSVTMTGSLAVFTAGTSPEFQVVSGGTIKGNALTDVHQVTGSLRITGSVASFSVGCTGIGIATPVDRLHVSGNIISEGCFFSGAPDNLRIFAGHWSTVSGNSNCYLVLQAGGGSAAFGTPQGWGGSASIYTCNQTRLSIDTNGIASFSCQVCAPRLEILRSGANNGLFIYSNAGATPISCTMVQINGLTNDSTGNILTLGSLNAGIRMIVRNDGNVGIGGTPWNKLSVYTGATNVLDVFDTGGSFGIGMQSINQLASIYKTWDFYASKYQFFAGQAIFSCTVCLPASNTSLVAGTYGTISNVGGIDTNIGNNAYYDGTNWRRFAAQEAARIYINRDSFTFLRKASDGAGSTISWDNTLFLAASGVACFACQVCAPLHVGNVRGQATIKKAVGSMNGGGSSQLIYLTSNIQADYGINDYSISVFAAGNSAEQSSLRALAAYGYYASSVTTTELAKFLSSPDAHSQLSFGICKLGSSNTYCYAVFFAKSSGTISGYCVTVTFNGITAGGAGDASTY